MNKNNIIKASIIVIIFVVIISAISIVNLSHKNEEFKIIDSLGNEIENLEENKMPFTIEKGNKNQKIIVNGKEYEEGQRIYKVGKYEIDIEEGNKVTQKIVNIKEIERKEENEYNIYVMMETLQTLLMNLKMADNNNQNAFFWTGTTSTVNMENLSKNFKNIQISEYNGQKDSNVFKTKVLEEMNTYIKETLKKNPDAYFHLCTEEDNYYLELELFGKLGLDDNRYDVTIYSNGTLSYVRGYEITKNNKYERYLEEKTEYQEIIEKIRNNTLEHNDYPGSYLVDEKSEIFHSEYNYDYMLISTQRENVKYLLQYPEFFEFKDENIKKEMESANIEKIVAQDEYNKLNEEEKNVFFENINLNKEELDNNYFQEENGKYLIISGTVPFYNNYTETKFKEIINEVYNNYKDEYVILYKPHPRAIPDEEQSKFLEELDIKILPGKIPMEAIMFIYPNLKIGGFASSLYMSLDEGKAEFFFAKDKNELVEPLNELYDKLFEDAKFYN